MRVALVYHSGEVGPYSQHHSLHPAEALQDQYFDELPVGFADDAPNLITLVGAVIWILACRFLNDPEDWHFSWRLLTQFKDILPFPELVGTQLESRNHLKRLWLEGSLCFRGVFYFNDDKDYLWMSYAAIVIYIKSLNLGPKFEGCSKCHAAYLMVVTGSGSGAEVGLAQGSDDCQLPDSTAPSTPPDDINGLYLPPSVLDKSSPLDVRQLLLNTHLQKLVLTGFKKIASIAAEGLHLDILKVAAHSDTQATIPPPSSSNIVELDITKGQQTPANSTQPGDIMTSRFNAAPNGELKKRHKNSKIKEILIDMLREIDFPLHNRYLPWSTLEGDLQKHGYEITKWPSCVPRENDKGIHTLSAGHIHKLYLALTQARVEDRPRFVRCVGQSAALMDDLECINHLAVESIIIYWHAFNGTLSNFVELSMKNGQLRLTRAPRTQVSPSNAARKATSAKLQQMHHAFLGQRSNMINACANPIEDWESGLTT
ncbi:hypothetical protein BDN67DRAFT_1045129 [Paxillus ammoniavirescens]|nr:hypothetical protein BDN67DRAFT_1045129 [Paxillus ammoniavirescens]